MSDILRTRFLSDSEVAFLEKSFPEINSATFCPTCNGAGMYKYRTKRNRRCDCDLQRQLFKHYTSAGIPMAYQRLDWADFNGSVQIKKAATDYLAKFKDYANSAIGLLLIGGNGIGKTLIMTLLLKDLVKTGVKGYFITADDLFAMKTDGWTDEEEKRRFNTKVKNSRVLIIDDVGKEFSNKLTRQVLDSLIRYRAQNALTTLISSNKSLKELEADYGYSLISLLKESCIIKELEGEDYRQEAISIRLDEIDKGWTRPIA